MNNITCTIGIRQPSVEHIMRGTKTVEYRNRPIKACGYIYVYGVKNPGDLDAWEAVEKQLSIFQQPAPVTRERFTDAELSKDGCGG